MENIEEFCGDLLLTENFDGGEIIIENGLFCDDKKFTNAIYLSLFGGNKNDNGKTDSKATWWGNRFLGTNKDEKLVSKFQNIILSMPLNSKTIGLAEQAATEDLEWLKKEGICDEILVEIMAENSKRINLEIKINKNGELVEKGNFSVQWEAENGVRE